MGNQILAALTPEVMLPLAKAILMLFTKILPSAFKSHPTLLSYIISLQLYLSTQKYYLMKRKQATLKFAKRSHR